MARIFCLLFLIHPALAQSTRLPEVRILGVPASEGRLTDTGASPSLLLDSQTLRQSAQASVADLLRQQAGLNFTSFFGSTGTGVPQLRGFGEGASSRTLILLDGIPMNRPDLASPVWFEFPIAGLEQIELQRGARTVRYGSSALAGVISLETRRQVEAPEWSLQASLGSWNTKLFRLNGILPTSTNWTTSLSTDWFSTDGYRENSALESRALQFSLTSPADKLWQWQSTFSASDTALENPGGLSTADYQSNPRQSIFTRFGIGDQYRNDLTTLRTTQQLRYRPKPDQQWQLNASWTNRQRELNFGRGSHTDHDLDSLAFDLSHEWKTQNLSGTWGLRGSYDTLFLERFRDQDRRNRFATADLERHSIGGFARTDLKLDSRWTLSGGASWDHYDLDASALDQLSPADPSLNFNGGTNDQAWGTELSLDYRPDDHRRFWLRYDRTFRFPVLDEVAGYQGFILSTPINTDLTPETGHGFEFGTSYQNDRITASLTAFAQWLDDEILFDFNNNLNTNFANSRRLGIESRLSYEADNWQGILNYQWTNARFTNGPFSGQEIPLVPQHQLSAQVIWSPTESLNLALEWEWLDDAFEGGDFSNTRAKLPGRSLINLESRYALNDTLELYGRIDNLFDERWASLKFLGQWYPGNGRNLTLGLRAQF